MQAYASFIAALTFDTEHLDSLIACGDLQRNCLQLKEAAELFKRAQAVAPSREDVQKALAAVLTDLGKAQHENCCCLPT